ncbi:MAG: PspA/IM30 family protein [Proteobacteria bacterium]|jgi:phage shock protein A|nr:PspA/IM30 family protein [Pseudomonadota bacterium]MBW2625462.1 PspA/IM30 family protein [Deltaproteobacteria bacterium]
MGIMTRFTRLCKADIHGVMDQLEDKGLLLKQYMRDMEEELGRKEATLRQMVVSRDRAQQDYERYAEECEKLDQDIAAAIEKDKDDIARLLIKKIKPFAYHREELSRHIQNLGREIREFHQQVEEQRLQYEQLQLRAREYSHQAEREQWEKTISTTAPAAASREPTEEEVELELLKRKEAAKGGAEK